MWIIKLFYFQLFYCCTSNNVFLFIFFIFFFSKKLDCYSRIQATTGLGPSEKSCGSVNFLLIYLNDAYKRAIIKSQRQEEISLDVKNSLNALYDIQPLKTKKTKQLLGVGELRKHCKAELVPFVGLQNMVGF